MNDYLCLRGVEKSFHADTLSEVQALNNLSLSVKKGEWITIVGSNAAGKSSLFNAIAGTLVPDEGSIELDGQSILAMPEWERAKFITRVRQNPNDGIIRNMTLAENLSMAKLREERKGLGRGVKLAWKSEFRALLAPFKINLETRLDDNIDLLSGGQKQTVCLLMATIAHPKLLLLDEHTAALDPKISAQILSITSNLVRKYHITTLMITHNLHHAIHYGDRLVLLDRGRIAYESSGKTKKNLTAAKIIAKIEGHQAELEEDIR
jgi:putative ABC transport system ATP-binding protein